jgi:hypothetical protein
MLEEVNLLKRTFSVHLRAFSRANVKLPAHPVKTGQARRRFREMKI